MNKKSPLHELKGLIMHIPFGSLELVVYNTVLISNHSIQFEHSHNCFELYLQVEGNATLYVDGQCVELKQGQICWFNPCVTRSTFNDPFIEQKQFVVMFDFISRLKEDRDFYLDETIELQIFLKNVYSSKYWISDDLNRSMGIYRLLCDEMRDRKFGYLLKARNLLSSFVIAAIQSIGMQDSLYREVIPRHCGNLAIEVLSYIRNHYAENISLDSMAKTLNISPRHITRIMKSTFNTTFNKALTSFRIEHAKYYLCHTEFSLEHIAEKVGFSSLNVLYNNFKKTTGMTIAQYRKSMNDNKAP